MNITFLKLSLRNIRKQKLNSAINIIGLSIGLAAFLYLFLYIRYETSFDSFFPNKERIFRIVEDFQSKDQNTKQGFVSFPAAPCIKENIAGIENYCRVSPPSPNKCYIKNQLMDLGTFRFADANFFSFFHFELLSGDPKNILQNENNIILSENTAKRLFGSYDIIGKSLKWNHQNFTIAGIAKNPPSNTHLYFDAIGSIKYIEHSDDYWKGWGGGISFLSYVLLNENVTPAQIESQLPKLLDKQINNQWKDRGLHLSINLQNIEDIHLSDGSIDYDCDSNRSLKSLYILSIICLFILLMAIINYIILYSAQKIAKTKESYTLEVFGANKKGLFSNTFIEVLIISTLSVILSVIILLSAIPILSHYGIINISIKENIGTGILFISLFTILLSLIITILSNFKRIFSQSNLHGSPQIHQQNRSNHNGLLISFQFGIVIILLISIFTIQKQNKLLLNHELGINKENILLLESDEEFLNNELAIIKDKINQLAGVQAVSLSSQPIGTGITQNGYALEGQTERIMIKALYTDKDFLSCYGIHLQEGRNFSGNPIADKDVILVNQELIKEQNWKEPLNKTLERDGTLHVIGTINDFNFTSLQYGIQPMLIMANPDWDGWGFSTVSIRFQTNNIKKLRDDISKIWNKYLPESPYKISFFDDYLNTNYTSYLQQQKIITFFGFIGILIACIGLFGITVFLSHAKMKEIGIRKVNGAKIGEVLILLNKQFIKWVSIAFLVTIPIAWFLMHKWLQDFAYKTDLSIWIFATAGIITFFVALLTVTWQSWKAAIRNPIEALRDE